MLVAISNTTIAHALAGSPSQRIAIKSETMSGSSGNPLEIFETIDARGWQPPEPMVCALETLDRLPRGKKIVMLLHCEPRPLFKILTNNGFHYRCRFIPEGYFEVTIWHAADTLAASADLD